MPAIGTGTDKKSIPRLRSATLAQALAIGILHQQGANEVCFGDEESSSPA